MATNSPQAGASAGSRTRSSSDRRVSSMEFLHPTTRAILVADFAPRHPVTMIVHWHFSAHCGAGQLERRLVAGSSASGLVLAAPPDHLTIWGSISPEQRITSEWTLPPRLRHSSLARRTASVLAAPSPYSHPTP